MLVVVVQVKPQLHLQVAVVVVKHLLMVIINNLVLQTQAQAVVVVGIADLIQLVHQAVAVLLLLDIP